MASFTPAYIKLHETGELQKRIDKGYKILEDYVVCPRNCHVNRMAGEYGICRVGSFPMVSSYNPHFGEERGPSEILGTPYLILPFHSFIVS